MNLSRDQIITDLIPAYRNAHGMSVAEAQAQLSGYDIATLRRMRERQVLAGYLQPEEPTEPTPAPVDTQAQELAAAKEQAREIARQFALKEKQELLEQQRQIQFQIVTDALFRPNAIIPGKTLVDSEATRRQLTALVNPGEQINNPVVWLRKVFADNPNLGQTFIKGGLFEKVVTTQEQKQQDQRQLEADWITFLAYCRTSELIAPSHANFHIIRKALGAGLPDLNYVAITTLGDSDPYCMNGDGDLFELAPATPQDVARFRQERFEMGQANLKDLAKSNNIAELRRLARRDHERNAQTDISLRQEFDLSKGYEREVLQGRYLDELPTHYRGKPLDPQAIRAMDRQTMRPLVERYGTARITARLFGFKRVRKFTPTREPIDGAPEYIFEKGE